MRKDDLVKGRKYALRGKGPKTDAAFVKVTCVGPVRSRQCRIRHDEGELKGLEEWAPTRLVACAWGERKHLLRDEELAARLDEVDELVWDRVVEDAISDVMTASGEYTGFGRRWITEPAQAERYWRRAGLEGSPLEDHLANFVDRHGAWHLSFSTAQRAAEAFAAAEPELVDLFIRGWEERLKAQGGRCRNCGSRVELQFDHVIPVAMGGSSEPESLQVLCGPCNRRKGPAMTMA